MTGGQINEHSKTKPISVKARKAKARNLQNRIRDDIKRLYHLSEHDVRGCPMGISGPDVQLSLEARRYYNFSIECKRQNAINVWDSMDQATANAEKQGNMPQLIFQRDRSEILVCMRWEDWLKILADRK